MKVLELFSGTGSVGKVCKEKGWEVVSLDLTNADINIDILKWDYKKDYKEGDFDLIWMSPPCNTFSNCRRSWIGRKIKAFGDKIVTAELLDNDMEENGLPLLRKGQEIIDYFKPKWWFIENPQTSKMKNYLTDLNHYDVDYCKYSDWGYRKRTRIWTNNMEFVPKLCRKDCDNMFNPTKHKTEMSDAKTFSRHKNNLGNSNGNKMTGGSCGKLATRYRIPPLLIKELLDV
jgi:site-specific DNA-cytosine methylase